MARYSMYILLAMAIIAISSCTKGDEWQEKMLDSSKQQTLYGMHYAEVAIDMY